MKPEMDYTLYLCTDRQLMTTDTIEESVELIERLINRQAKPDHHKREEKSK